MRHFGGFVLGIIAIPLVLYGTGWGYAHTLHVAGGAPPTGASQALGFLALAGVGLLVGVVLAPRLSPLAAFLPAAALLAWTAALFWNSRAAEGWAPGGAAGGGMSALLASGLYGLLGVALLLPLLIPRRWRRREEPDRGEFPLFT